MELDHAPAKTQPAAPQDQAPATSAKASRAFPHGHVTAGSFASAVVALVVAYGQAHGVSGAVDAHAKEIASQLEAQGKAIDAQGRAIDAKLVEQGKAIAETAKASRDMQATLVRLEERSTAADRGAEQLRADLRDALSQIHTLDRATAKAEARLDDHDRRFQQERK